MGWGIWGEEVRMLMLRALVGGRVPRERFMGKDILPGDFSK